MIRLSTGIEGLDEVLLGGLPAGRIYLVRGEPGAGKTTLGMQFLMAGIRRGESVLSVTLSESEAELRTDAALHGWDLAGIEFLDIHPADEGASVENQYSIFHPADIELVPVSRRIFEAIDRLRPTRIVFDSLTQIRLLSRDPLRYRRQILGLKSELLSRGITSIFLDESSPRELDFEIASIVQGIIILSIQRGREGLTRRSIEVAKLRGSSFREGEHPFRLDRGGLHVFPRLLTLEHSTTFERTSISTGIEGLDTMLNGGFERGTSSLITGNAGVGKTILGITLIAQAAANGERGVLYTFDEEPAQLVYRSESIGLKVQGPIDAGLIEIRKVNPLVLYPDEFAAWVRAEVEERGTKIIMIDSLNGYNQSMLDENYLGGHMHQLIGYLNRMGVVTILVNEVSPLIGDFAATQFGISHMADTVIVLRYYEYAGAIHKAIGTLKKRLSDHEKTLRTFSVTNQGLVVGEVLSNLRGILRGEAFRSDSAVATEGDPDA